MPVSRDVDDILPSSLHSDGPILVVQFTWGSNAVAPTMLTLFDISVQTDFYWYSIESDLLLFYNW